MGLPCIFTLASLSGTAPAVLNTSRLDINFFARGEQHPLYRTAALTIFLISNSYYNPGYSSLSLLAIVFLLEFY